MILPVALKDCLDYNMIHVCLELLWDWITNLIWSAVVVNDSGLTEKVTRLLIFPSPNSSTHVNMLNRGVFPNDPSWGD